MLLKGPQSGSSWHRGQDGQEVESIRCTTGGVSTEAEGARGKCGHRLSRSPQEEERVNGMVGLIKQGSWAKWDSVEQQRVTWDSILQTDYDRVHFLIQPVYDGLPSPA